MRIEERGRWKDERTPPPHDKTRPDKITADKTRLDHKTREKVIRKKTIQGQK